MPKIFAVSDGTGTTADLVARAALTQFAAKVVVKRIAQVRTTEAIDELVAEALREDGIIVHTLVSEELRSRILSQCRERNVPTIDLMGPLLSRLSESLRSLPKAEPGILKPFDTENVQRIQAIDFSVQHDDGQGIGNLPKAEIVLVGVSRTTKTPVSIYLAYRGWRVANVPIVFGIEPPIALFSLPKRKVVGLFASAERLAQLRNSRVDKLGTTSTGYASLEYIRKELIYAYEIFEQRKDWKIVDVTHKSIEETAAEVVSIVGSKS